MEKPVEEPSPPVASRFGPVWEMTHALNDSVGRRGVRVYGLPSQQQAAVIGILMFVAMPLFMLLSMMPFWERLGEVWWVVKIDSYIAPTVGSLDFKYRAEAFPQFPLKRFMVAATSMVVLLFLGNFLSMFFRGVRKHALLVWLCFDRQKILFFLFVSGLMFAGIWYVLFYDWRILDFLSYTRGGQRITAYAVFAIPIVTLVFGHLTAIVVLGVCRSATKTARLISRKTLAGD
jgi:hypothetical protein